VPPPAVSSAAVAAALVDGTASLRLQSWTCRCALPDAVLAPLLQTLPAARLTRLQFHSNGLSPLQLAALTRRTQLQSCAMVPSLQMGSHYMGDEALQQLAALQQLTRLQLGEVECAQLRQLLQLRQLQGLEVELSRYSTPGCWDLSQFTALLKLKVTVGTSPLLPEDQLPPNLHELVWAWRGTIRCLSGATFSMQPILALSCLQKLHLWQMCAARAATAAELAQLSSLRSFTDSSLSFIDTSEHVARATAHWQCLPL
jgi:hypothetical protein